MSNYSTPNRFDYVGSFLRPEALKKARRAFDQGEITHDELTKVENEAITNLVAKLKELGYDTTRIEQSLADQEKKPAEVVEMPKSSDSNS